ncbi:L-cysteine:1D-myo-inositol 2-amino-2-deoxy-alpha-D-glucopyranoside ligase [Austwickia chelonae]|uniref:L-cysteine:1D-myo-inositol 2-amino-2-deoxy-alpha-D-glucopyranoside ligase n=1 Tax=Austwickia chelonae NBRC 105200 TaxID=1184607 RepID=K6VP46_9MICO|nr:cysteine--1-D-myo-inosityl 2-amino-2-deoxy-alpha-D-glucopyranoside ligase [Austwickia chelonae]GAB77140.1 cysteine--1D-myo-inosityl 2-amino-2-deoxy-alpha-D-glucopyranoside ligase MshC [Austwickia chelonae NBRC 105200]SEW03643.1 L-cysteine:1D-myo-inositol 2-amino-2-deoxy-alpha-D-glucopyranoside ligase [Austwickia chelonae]
MIAWDIPHLPVLAGHGPEPTVTDSHRGPVTLDPGPVARMYVCGITPYDATHMGHAATYVTFDILNRILRDAGHQVVYVQNVTDVDDPLLERAHRDGVDWQDLALAETQLFRDDMNALRVIPPDHYVGVVESIPLIEEQVAALLAQGHAYQVDIPAEEKTRAGTRGDIYLDLAACPDFGATCGWDEHQMDEVFADRGGDPGRAGKRGRFDPLLWRGARGDEPFWPSDGLGPGRPGWHIECTAIALHHLGMGFDVQGGGTDLVFPHHEMSAVQANALTGQPTFATAFVHQAMVGYQGHKMSKSRGNLVLVSRLRAQGVDPMAVRLTLLAHHYATEWEWQDPELQTAQERLATWRSAVATDGPPADTLLEQVRQALADDLDTPRALQVIDDWADRALRDADTGEESTDPQGPAVRDLIDALLGIAL